jgi:hypothetical protein
MKLRPFGAEFLQANGVMDGRTDRETARHDEANSGFLQFCQDIW